MFRSKRTGCAPIYVTIGDGGNREGLSEDYLKKPDWSAVREASFGMGTLTVENGSHAVWRWHRNKDDVAEVGFLITSELDSCTLSHHAYASFPNHVEHSMLYNLATSGEFSSCGKAMKRSFRTAFILDRSVKLRLSAVTSLCPCMLCYKTATKSMPVLLQVTNQFWFGWSSQCAES